jgi:hypothetical protein
MDDFSRITPSSLQSLLKSGRLVTMFTAIFAAIFAIALWISYIGETDGGRIVLTQISTNRSDLYCTFGRIVIRIELRNN